MVGLWVALHATKIMFWFLMILGCLIGAYPCDFVGPPWP
jgi:hypothetical protein